MLSHAMRWGQSQSSCPEAHSPTNLESGTQGPASTTDGGCACLLHTDSWRLSSHFILELWCAFTTYICAHTRGIVSEHNLDTNKKKNKGL